MTFTKEQLINQAQKNIAVLRGAVERIPGASEAAVIHLRLAEITLASLEAEAVAFIGQRMLEELTDAARSCGRVWSEVTDKLSDENRIPLYTAPPAAVVPDALYQFAEFMAAESIKSGDYPDGWQCKASNAAHEYAQSCRAAMLQGAAGISPAIPDGWVACSERMPEEGGRYWCYVEEQNDLGKSHYQWNCAWNGGRWWVESDNGGRVTHWMRLPAAPQQEAR